MALARLGNYAEAEKVMLGGESDSDTTLNYLSYVLKVCGDKLSGLCEHVKAVLASFEANESDEMRLEVSCLSMRLGYDFFYSFVEDMPHTQSYGVLWKHGLRHIVKNGCGGELGSVDSGQKSCKIFSKFVDIFGVAEEVVVAGGEGESAQRRVYDASTTNVDAFVRRVAAANFATFLTP